MYVKITVNEFSIHTGYNLMTLPHIILRHLPFLQNKKIKINVLH